MKKTFIAGLATLLPLAITIFVIVFLVDLLTDPFLLFVENLLSGLDVRQEVLVFISRLFTLCALFFITFLLGLIGKRIAFSWIDYLFAKIPLLKTIYTATAELSRNVFKQGASYFEKRVLVKYPSDVSLALGFQSKSPPPQILKHLPNENYATIFVPTSPHPISGFLLLMQIEDVKEIDLTTEELFSVLVSCGLYTPRKTR